MGRLGGVGAARYLSVGDNEQEHRFLTVPRDIFFGLLVLRP